MVIGYMGPQPKGWRSVSGYPRCHHREGSPNDNGLVTKATALHAPLQKHKARCTLPILAECSCVEIRAFT